MLNVDNDLTAKDRDEDNQNLMKETIFSILNNSIRGTFTFYLPVVDLRFSKSNPSKLLK